MGMGLQSPAITRLTITVKDKPSHSVFPDTVSKRTGIEFQGKGPIGQHPADNSPSAGVASPRSTKPS